MPDTKIDNSDFNIKTLGPCLFDSPVPGEFFAVEHERILVDPTVDGQIQSNPPSFELAGPRKKIFFNPNKTRIGIVTCGGLCPGINDVIRAIVMVSWYRYGVKNIFGFKYGYKGLTFAGETPISLTPELVEDIHQDGGTILRSSRGPQPVGEMVDFLTKHKIDILFTIGGDGTQAGSLEIAAEIEKRNLKTAVIGIPKTIDNDLCYTDRTFGFSTAVAQSQQAIDGAHVESKGVEKGVGLVKLMGRDSGFIAVYASIASSDVNLVLIPEVPFTLPAVMNFLRERLVTKSHAVIVVAEGAGQHLFDVEGADKSGNKKLGDIGMLLKTEIAMHFRNTPTPAEVKYIDPSYIIRSAPANAEDSVFCFLLAENAVHAAMAGKTEMVASQWNSHFVHVPTKLVVGKRKQVDPASPLYRSVLSNTGQPPALQ